MQASVDYFGGDELAATVWLSKYALKDSDGNIYERTPDDMHRRIARELARIELKYANPVAEADIYATLKDFRYIVPQGSPMAGIGNNFQVSSLSNCFVIGNGTRSDSYGGIMKIDQEQVQLMKRRGGVGHDLSHIRPAGSPVKNSALTSTGIVPFMERYSNSTREVAQDGRRGALMLTISIKHPDSEDFIDAKLEAGKVTGANVSVKIDDEFMQCVRDNKPYTQQFPIDADQPTYSKTIDARKLWNKIIHNAWRSAEPGILFWDTVIRESVPDSYADQGFTTVSTNPCGEIPLCPYDSCRLLAINLYSYVEQPFTENATFNRELFAKHAHVAQRMMDNIIDLEVEKVDGILHKIDSDPEGDEVKRVERKLWENIRKKTLQGRRTGIGITSEGDMLAALNLRYGTPEATSFSTDIHKLLATEVYRSSVALAKDRGAFEVFDFEKEKNNPFIQRLGNEDAQIIEDMKQHGRRNIALLTIAPTGSVSICTQTTSGIEPVFMPAYKRRRKVNPNDVDARITFVDDIGDSWEEYQVFHPKFDVWLRQHGHDPKEVRTYTETEIEKLVKKSPYYKATSNDIDWVEKVKMQGAVQKWVDHSISVTVNLPADATEELVSNVYMTAWESGCKGMTIYRDGSRSGVLVSNKKKDENAFKETQAPQRPRKLKADVMWFHNDEERWVAVVGLLDNRPYEIFTGKARGFFVPEWVTKGWVIKNKENNQSRYDFQFLDSDGYKITMEGLSRQFNKEYWNYAKLISGILRHGMPLPYVVDIVEKLVLDNDAINSWKKGIVRSLKKYIPDGTAVKKEACPDCGMEGTLEYKEGCKTCNSCNWTACS
ncbi:MAG: adenosylcobalamin-dependent ribonucleoside-diphosphate reductase [Bacteroidales bacterium]|nr:adenosylcobalamin-dependent ribonucleoside-diphosphate reductase [Bacteroidales bacterium]MDD2633603.1 adenosylcobalamin-dependent ribonucleoside-diphosphate reductase [Bacteroidales bacterium]MDD3132077.1 adenosylcobalamin-dependent ribonucleoside-diphosphate reductase [Bacteroidales bacterium]MDD3526923.1 adenosylcobalamin-dependent ribonucleoside-diphosphate reductase [Bacteroidales bacterium]MDD4177062.1 adenosylcobalamin-dependent ribonucleoside-diphosphate reductase [Bacteroidales bact